MELGKYLNRVTRKGSDMIKVLQTLRIFNSQGDTTVTTRG